MSEAIFRMSNVLSIPRSPVLKGNEEKKVRKNENLKKCRQKETQNDLDIRRMAIICCKIWHCFLLTVSERTLLKDGRLPLNDTAR